MSKIPKKNFDLNKFKKEHSSSTKYKPERFYDCGEAFQKACGLPGPVIGGINMFLGHSNTGKTTALVKAIQSAQKMGHLPIIIITERKWSWKHAQVLGLECQQDADGSWNGDFIFRDDFRYIEEITDFINEMLDKQKKGELPMSIHFVWDSVGSVPCKMTYEGKGGKMHNASALQDKIGMGLHGRITESKKEDFPYDNTLTVVNQPWVELPDSPFGQPEIKARGGTTLWLAAELVFLFGNQKKAGINHLDATKDGRKVSFAIRTKVSVLKNHVNGLAYKDGKIIAVPQGFIDDTKEALEDYKKEYSQYWTDILGGSDFAVNDAVEFVDEEDF